MTFGKEAKWNSTVQCGCCTSEIDRMEDPFLVGAYGYSYLCGDCAENYP